MNMRLLTVILFSFVLSSVAEAIDASVQYRPGEGNDDYRKYRPASPASGQSSTASRQGDQFRSLIEKTVKAKDAVYENAWSGTRKELEAVVTKAESEYGFEDSKHLGRNATMLVPATREEMLLELAYGSGWKKEPLDGYHAPDAERGDNLWTAKRKSGKGEIEKYTDEAGREVVYNLKTGRIVADGKMGTKNFEPEYNNGLLNRWRHKRLDVNPHNAAKNGSDRYSKDGDQYKYVGILYERDLNDPDKYYIIDGQTGLPMTPQQVAEMPTTLSDMWKDMGLVCVANDAADIVPPKPKVGQDKKGRGKSPDRNNTNGDWDCCKCENPEDKDFCCKKCGKMSKWLAPKQDLEFLQFLNK